MSNEWISVSAAPLIYTSPTGSEYPTVAGKGKFLCAIPHKLMWEEGKTGWTIMFITLDDDCSIRLVEEIDDDEDREKTWFNVTGKDITHYIPEPEPPNFSL